MIELNNAEINEIRQDNQKATNNEKQIAIAKAKTERQIKMKADVFCREAKDWLRNYSQIAASCHSKEHQYYDTGTRTRFTAYQLFYHYERGYGCRLDGRLFLNYSTDSGCWNIAKTAEEVATDFTEALKHSSFFNEILDWDDSQLIAFCKYYFTQLLKGKNVEPNNCEVFEAFKNKQKGKRQK